MSEETENQEPAEVTTEAVENETVEETPAEEPEEQKPDLSEMLDDIVEPDNDDEEEEDEPEPAQEPQQDKPQQPEDPELNELTADVKSERSKERIAELLQGHRKLKQESASIKQENDKFSSIIRNTGMNASEFAHTIEFCRLSRSDNEADLKVALDVLEQERQSIYDKLGKVAPGSDPLAGHDDLKQGVEDLTIDEARAIELANARRLIAQQKQAQQQQFQQQQRVQAYQAQVRTFQNQATMLFNQLKQTDPNFSGKEKALAQYLTPERQQQMVNTMPPEQWLYHVKAIYDALPVQQVQPQKLNTPLSTRPQALSRPAIKGNSARDIASSVLENLGL